MRSTCRPARRSGRSATAYPAPRVAGHQTVPATGIPGGAVTADRSGDGYITDVVLGDLYGNLWVLDPTTGANHFAGPAFSFSSDYHPIGAPPAIYSNGGQQYAAFVSGGYADLSDSTWGTATQELVSVRISDAHLGFEVALTAGERGYAQAHVVGTQVFVTTDTADINAATYGAGTTGHVYGYDLAGSSLGAPMTIISGAGSLAHLGTTLYASAGSAQQQLSSAANTATGPSVGLGLVPACDPPAVAAQRLVDRDRAVERVRPAVEAVHAALREHQALGLGEVHHEAWVGDRAVGRHVTGDDVVRRRHHELHDLALRDRRRHRREHEAGGHHHRGRRRRARDGLHCRGGRVVRPAAGRRVNRLAVATAARGHHQNAQSESHHAADDITQPARGV